SSAANLRLFVRSAIICNSTLDAHHNYPKKGFFSYQSPIRNNVKHSPMECVRYVSVRLGLSSSPRLTGFLSFFFLFARFYCLCTRQEVPCVQHSYSELSCALDNFYLLPSANRRRNPRRIRIWDKFF